MVKIKILGSIVFLLSLSNCSLQESVDIIDSQITELKINYRFFEVEKEISILKRRFPNNIRAQNLIADWSYFVMDYEKAESLYTGILVKDSLNIGALNGKAMIALDNEHIEKAFEYINKALMIDSSNISTCLNYSKILLENRDVKNYIIAINKALEIDSLNSDALASKGYYFAALNYNINEGAKYFNRAIELNPLNRMAHHFLGRGYSPENYNNEKPFINKALISVDSLLKLNQFKLANKLISFEYLKDSTDLTILKLKAACEFQMGNYRKTIEYAFKILKRRPNYGLAHYFIAESLNKLKYEHNILMKKIKIDSEKRLVPDAIPFLEDIFINYHQCDEELQKIIRINTFPFNGFMEALALSGATIYFMDFHSLMFECPYLTDRKGTRVVDFRLLDDIKGQGGYHMTSNKLQQSEEAYGLFNVAFHEFGHLIQWLFTYEQNAELMRLFTKAKLEKHTLDWYSDMNVQEYFAQGVEAYLSERKLPGQSDVTNNTKQELLKMDVNLYNFIESLANQKSYKNHIVQAYIVKSWYVNSVDEALIILNDAAARYPESPELLIEIGNSYRENADFRRAAKFHRQVIENFPKNLQAQLELSYDIFLQGNNTEESIKILEKLKSNPKFDSKMYRFLGLYYTDISDCNKAIEALDIAMKLEPFPNPYDISLPDVYFLMAKALIKTEDIHSAEKNLLRSLEINRSNAETYAELAFVNLLLNNFEEANKYIMTGNQLDSTNMRVIEVYKLLKK